jgi:tetratricopeptide (TPR) repeat protein
MFFLFRQASRSSGAVALAGAFLLFLLPALTTLAQSDTIDTEPNRGGLNTIQGNVYLPSGHRLDRPVRVRLNSIRTFDSYAMTDSNGTFYFRRLPGGSYRITVDAGQEYETAYETVEVLGDGNTRRSRGGGQTITVQIQLQTKGASSGKAAAIDAAQAALPKRARELYDKALKDAEVNEHKKAIEHLEGAIKVYPDFALAYNELGVQRLKLGETATALEAFRIAHKLAPDALMLQLNYGIALVKNKEFGDGESELHKVLEKNSSSTTAHLYRGRALIGLKRDDDAEKELLMVVSADKGSEVGQAYRYLGALYIQNGKRERAVDALEHFLALEPKDKDSDQIRKILEQLRSTK